MKTRNLSPGILRRVWMRSLLLQGSWNFERMQNLGTLFVLAPALRHLYTGEELTSAFRRHLMYFNTHPFLAPTIFGTTLALEEDRSRGESMDLGVEEFKGMIMAPFAAMGDGLFWGGLRPLAAGIALFFAANGSSWTPLIFLFLFNVPHLWLRFSGLGWGYHLGIDVVEILQRRHLPDLAVRCKEATVVLFGALSAYLVFNALRHESLPGWWGLMLLGPMALVALLVRKGWSPLTLVLLVAGGIVMLTEILHLT